jgi:hypothetical protein
MLIRGEARWAKVVGEPQWGYENKFKQWSLDVYVDEPTVERLKNEGLASKIRNKGNGPYLTFNRKELKGDGTPNQPIRIVDHKGQEWNGTKIGNGSIVNVNFAINEYGKNGEKALNILSMQVWDHVKFGDEFPVKEDTEDGNWEKDAA